MVEYYIRIFDQVGTLLVEIDAVDAISDIYGIDDGIFHLAFKCAHATLCAVVADTSGAPHIYARLDPNVKKSIMQTGNLNIVPNTWCYGRNFEHVEDPIKHFLILIDADKFGHNMDQILGSLMKRIGFIILNIKCDSAGMTEYFYEIKYSPVVYHNWQ